jgi:hypothetical protein
MQSAEYDLTIVCDRPGFDQATYFEHSGAAGATFGNIVLGGGIGWAIDPAAGADNKYDRDEPREIGRADPLPLGQCGKRHAIAAAESGIELARPDQQLDELGIGFCCGKWFGPLDQHPDRPPGAA